MEKEEPDCVKWAREPLYSKAHKAPYRTYQLKHWKQNLI
jgi:hypothetical protein